ncbi:MAG: hypothetical protein K5668_00050, partial [Lachnospiraceae bacterium]|nr:hypothetical protein [Lachnospiraceae bacterium]
MLKTVFKNLKSMALFLPLFMLLFSADVFAVPANSKPMEYTQSDGSKITVSLHGDEYFHYYADLEGYLLILADDKDFHYIKKDGDSLFLFPSIEEAYGNKLMISDLYDEDIKRQFAILSGRGTGEGFKKEIREPVTLDKLEGEAGDAGLDSIMDSSGLKTMPLITIVVSFNNVPYREDYVWSEKLYGEGDTLQNYYYEMSDHKFTFVPAEENCEIDNGTTGFDEINDGIIHVTVGRDHGVWEDLNNDDAWADLAVVLREALEKSAYYYIDITKYDKNNNRQIDTNELGISFIIAGYNCANMLDPSVSANERLWPHKFSFSCNALGLTYIPYIAIAENIKHTGYPEKQEYPGVIYHELGHYIGFQDLYDIYYYEEDHPELAKWRGYDTDLLSIMHTGSYATEREGGNYKATGIDAFNRALLHWIEPEEVTEDGVYTLSSQESSNGYNILRIPTGRKGEYYLLENRRAEGMDEGLWKYGDYMANGEQSKDPNGIVIWHIEKNVYDEYEFDNEVNTADHCPAVMPLFPEGKAAGDSYINWQFSEYTLDFNNSLPNFRLPFYNRSNFEKVFKNTEGYEKGLFLPLYGEGNDKDDPDKRTLSGINLRFIDDPSRDIRVEISGLPEKVTDRFESGKALSEILTEEDKALLNDPDASTVSKNELLSAVNRAIDKRVEGVSTLS